MGYYSENNMYFQFVLVLIVALGMKKALQIIKKCPEILLMPLFSFITIGPIQTQCLKWDAFVCNKMGNRKKIGVSYWHTLMNVFITMFCTIFGYILGCIFYSSEFWRYCEIVTKDGKPNWTLLAKVVSCKSNCSKEPGKIMVVSLN